LADIKFSNMIIGLLVLTLVVSSIALFMGGLNQAYNPGETTEFDNFTSDFVSEQNATMSRLDTARSNLTNVKEDSGVLDRLSSFFRAGYDTSVVLIDSFGSFGRLTNTAIRQIPFLGTFGGLLISILIGIILIVIVVKIFLHFLIKSDRL
jgi:hypothetical protein